MTEEERRHLAEVEHENAILRCFIAQAKQVYPGAWSFSLPAIATFVRFYKSSGLKMPRPVEDLNDGASGMIGQ